MKVFDAIKTARARAFSRPLSRRRERAGVRVVLPLAVLLSFSLFISSASPASAAPLPPGSKVAVLPTGGDPDAPEKLKRETAGAVERALIGMQHQVMASDEASRELSRLGRDPCRVLRTCDQAAALEALKADAVVSVALWLAEDGKSPQQVVVRVTRRDGWGLGEVTVGESGLADAVGAALALALRDSEKRREVVLRVEAEPAGARVEVDHQPIGVAPAEIAVQPGKRMIAVSAAGHVTESSYVEVPAEGPRPFVYRIALSKDVKHTPDTQGALESSPAGPADRSYRTGSSPWNYAIGGVLVAASAPLILFPMGTVIRAGDCAGVGAQLDDARQCRRYHFGTQSTLMLAGGLVALGGGVAILLTRPIRARESLAVEAGLDGLRITAAF